MNLRKIGIYLVSLLLASTLIAPQAILATEVENQPGSEIQEEKIQQKETKTEETVILQDSESELQETPLPTQQPISQASSLPEVITEEVQLEESVLQQVENTNLQQTPTLLSGQYKPNFSVRARNIMNKDWEKGTEYLQQQPATYRIEKSDGTLSFTGTSSTFDVWANFVHWTVEKGEGNYFRNEDDTRLFNLPNGDYKVIRVFAGKNINSLTTSSSTPFFAAGGLQTSGSEQYYTFKITDDLVDEFMNEVVNNNQGNSIFFGFAGAIPDLNKKIFVIFDSNGGYGSMPVMRNLPQNSTVELTKNVFYNYDADFIGWNTVQNPTPENPGIAYPDQASLDITTSDVTLYAQWKAQEKYYHTVYLCDLVSGKAVSGGRKTVTVNGLAYTNEELNEIVEKYKNKNNYGEDKDVILSEVRVKQKSQQDPDKWNLYSPDMIFENREEIAYLVYIDKVEEKVKVTFKQGLHGQLLGQNENGEVVYEIKKGTSLTQNNIVVPQISPDGNYEIATPFGWDKEILLNQLQQEDVTYTAQYSEKKQEPAPIVTPTPVPPVTPQQPDPVDPEIPAVVPQPIVIIPEQQPQQNTPTPEVIPEQKQPENNPVENIEEEINPLLGASGNWALLNLVCTLATMLIAIILLVSKRQREQKNQQDQQETTKLKKQRRWTKVAGILVSVGSILCFVLTENMKLPMILMDKWTLLMVVLLLSQCIVFFTARSWKEEEDEEESQLTTKQ